MSEPVLGGPRPSTQVTPETLDAFAALVRERFGLAHAARNRPVLERRLAEALSLAGWRGGSAAFVRRLSIAEETSPLLVAAAEALTNQETSFFRDVGQLRGIVQQLVPAMALRTPGREPLRLLSAGCATGEEALSLAMLLLDELHLCWGRPLEVVGVDVSARAIERARAGLYPESAAQRAGPGPEGWVTRFFRREEGGLRARGFLRAVTSFARGNLVAPETLAGLGRFDLVVCRNVLIYFDPETIERAVGSLLTLLRPGGALVLGHAESGHAASLQPCLRRSGGLLWFGRTAEAA